MGTVFPLSIGRHYILTILVLNFEIVYSATSCNIAVCMANSVDPDQTSHSVVSDQCLHSLQRPICPNT